MTPEHAEKMIARCEAKRDAATDPQSRFYYTACLVGWRDWLSRHGDDAPEAIGYDVEDLLSPHSALKSHNDTK